MYGRSAELKMGSFRGQVAALLACRRASHRHGSPNWSHSEVQPWTNFFVAVGRPIFLLVDTTKQSWAILLSFTPPTTYLLNTSDSCCKLRLAVDLSRCCLSSVVWPCYASDVWYYIFLPAMQQPVLALFSGIERGRHLQRLTSDSRRGL